jgi:hypothetical protein
VLVFYRGVWCPYCNIGLPMPTVAILDAGHVLRWIDVHPDYSTRTEPAQVLGALDQLGI